MSIRPGMDVMQRVLTRTHALRQVSCLDQKSRVIISTLTMMSRDDSESKARVVMHPTEASVSDVGPLHRRSRQKATSLEAVEAISMKDLAFDGGRAVFK